MNWKLLPRKASGILLLLFLGSCATSNMFLDVMKPAQINLPQEIQTIAVVNRSYPDKEQEVNNVVEGLISGEGVLNDRFGSQACIQGFVNALGSSPAFPLWHPTSA